MSPGAGCGMYELSTNLRHKAFWLCLDFFNPQALMGITVSFTFFYFFYLFIYFLSNANFSIPGCLPFSSALSMTTSNARVEEMSEKRKRKRWHKSKLKIYGIGECVHWGDSYVCWDARDVLTCKLVKPGCKTQCSSLWDRWGNFASYAVVWYCPPTRYLWCLGLLLC